MPSNKAQIAVYAISALLVADFILFGYLPSKRRLSTLLESRHSQEASIAQAKADASQLAALRQAVSQSQILLEEQRQYIPQERHFNQFLEDVSELMQRHKLREQLIEPGRDVLGSNSVCIPVTLRCQGAFAQLFAFYQDLQKMPRLIRFEEIMFDRHPTATTQVEMIAHMAIYYQPDVDYDPLTIKSRISS
ncbi:type 4a pilus biogenesis protein PilO [Planctomycetota bacterium]